MDVNGVGGPVGGSSDGNISQWSMRKAISSCHAQWWPAQRRLCGTWHGLHLEPPLRDLLSRPAPCQCAPTWQTSADNLGMLLRL